MNSKRIEYIDAMRGFTMILVIFSHVILFGFNETLNGYNDVFVSFRMPLFFFISGWLFYKPDRIWNICTIKSIISNKFIVQIIPTLVFFIIFLYVQNAFEASSFGNTKKGYWFTIALFEYFIIYIIISSQNYTKVIGNSIIIISALIISFISEYYENSHTAFIRDYTNSDIFLSAIGFTKLKYYIFFVLGIVAKQYFSFFIKVTNNNTIITITIVTFMLFILFPFVHTYNWTRYLAFIVSGITGVIIVFTFFRINASHFKQSTIIGKGLQFIGRRTLDIYLLHYFFVYGHFEKINTVILLCDNTVIELFVILIISIMVLSITICVSSILRLSPFLAHYLFGIKREGGKETNQLSGNHSTSHQKGNGPRRD